MQKIENVFNKLLIPLAGVAALIPVNASSRDVGRWVIGGGQGVIEYSIYNDSNDLTNFVISDASEATSGEVEIFIRINGASPSAFQAITIEAGASRVEFTADRNGNIATNCHVCASNFDVLWHLMRRERLMRVRFGSRAATFSLVGSSRVLGAVPPKADFYR